MPFSDSHSISLKLNRNGAQAQPLYFQIYQRFRDAIIHGSLPAGARVPSIRVLAAELQLSRNTVEKAYSLLIGEGYFLSGGQAGTVVAAIKHARIACDTNDLNNPTSLQSPRSDEHTLDLRPFMLGVPALDAFPLSQWLTLNQRILRQRNTTMQMIDRQGHPELRKMIATYLQISRGVACTASQVFIVDGYRQALNFLCTQILSQGDQVWIEDPVYLTTLRVLNRSNTRIEAIPVPVDMAGIDVSAGCRLAPEARMAIVTPANQSPLGVVLSLPRRGQLLAWAERAEGWVIEDDYDSEFCDEGRLLPTLYSQDRAGRTIYLGTFSKALHPMLRVAYFVVPPRLVHDMRTACLDLLDGSNIALQLTLAAFMKDGTYAMHIKKMRSVYKHRRQMLVDAIESICGDQLKVAQWARGLSVLAHLPHNLSDLEIVKKAEICGLSPSALSSRFIKAPPEHGLRLGYANFETELAVRNAVNKLANCL